MSRSSFFTKLLRSAGWGPRRPQSTAGSESPALVTVVTEEHDRAKLLAMCGREPWDLYLAESCEEAWRVAEHRHAPVILYDRDFPRMEWRGAVGMLSALPQRPIVVLLSQVADEYLWNELFRIGGFDLLRKPLRSDELSRVLKLALSYWSSKADRTETGAFKSA